MTADLRSSPKGPRDRQLLRGAAFRILDLQDGFAYGYAEQDGFCGWVEAAAFVPNLKLPLTHRVSVARSYAKTSAGLKTMGQVTPLPFGAAFSVLETNDNWAKVAWHRGTIPRDLFVPTQHLKTINQPETDPAAVAELFIGTPYLWGGNSSFGIDCSGLVQSALLTCRIPCPGDSDLQETAFPEATGPYARGDLLFWKGHVAMVTGSETLIHANAFHMAVTYEPIEQAIARIANQGDGAVSGHKRPIIGDTE
ncbi:MAG: C40 family peptidase [Shimia sp.]|uniref:C40 family peptidase n=1 Tax=Shimia sp. TaxID=1954381 RepID=UPI0040595186